MPSIMTLSGDSSGDRTGLGRERCKCVMNPRTKRGALLCFVGKGKGKGKTRSGWAFAGKCR